MELKLFVDRKELDILNRYSKRILSVFFLSLFKD